jgi:hypothetical protein
MSIDDRRPASHGARPDPHEANELRSYAERVAPEITVDTSGVFRAARRRRAGPTGARPTSWWRAPPRWPAYAWSWRR